MADHVNTYLGLVNQLAAMRGKFDDEVLGLGLLGSFTGTLETFRTYVSNSAQEGVVTLD